MPARPAILVLHRAIGLVLAVFISLHLVNHALLAIDPAMAFAFMDDFRHLYRHPVVEPVLLAAVLFQMLGGAVLARRGASLAARISGYYLLFFLLVHIAAVLFGRLGLGLDTDIHFAAAGLRTWPSMAFFLPYYFLAVVAVCFHAGLGIARLVSAPRRPAVFASAAVGVLAGIVILGGMLHLVRTLSA